MSMRGRSISMRWGSSETVRLSGGGSRLIELWSLREGTTSDVVLVGGVSGSGTGNVYGYPSLVLAVAPPTFLFFLFFSESLTVSSPTECFGRRFS